MIFFFNLAGGEIYVYVLSFHAHSSIQHMYSICTGCWVTATLTRSVSNGVVILGTGVSGGRLIGSSEPAK